MKKIKFIPFRFKLGLVVSVWVSLVIIFLGTNIYNNIKHTMEKQYNVNGNVMNSLEASNYYMLYKALDKIALYIFIALIISIGISILLGSVLANFISRPIKKMMVGMEEISNGNLNYKIDIRSKDEFRLLGRNFNNMTHHIRKLIEERNKREEELSNKNNEILVQRDEINALYEETTAMNEELEFLLHQNQKNYFVTVKALVNSIEAKDKYTRGHCERVMEYVLKIGEAMDLTQGELEDLKYAALLHDVGKIGVPSSIINKGSKLTEDEMELVKMHSILGYEILKDVPFLENARKAILHHHERIDGRGYPDALKDKEISLLSKILAVADAFDAMTTGRSYRMIPFTKKMALEQLIENKNLQFDPEIVDIFVTLMEREYIQDLSQNII